MMLIVNRHILPSFENRKKYISFTLFFRKLMETFWSRHKTAWNVVPGFSKNGSAFNTVLLNILVRIRIRGPYQWLKVPDPNTLNKYFFHKVFYLLLFEGTFTSVLLEMETKKTTANECGPHLVYWLYDCWCVRSGDLSRSGRIRVCLPSPLQAHPGPNPSL